MSDAAATRVLESTADRVLREEVLKGRPLTAQEWFVIKAGVLQEEIARTRVTWDDVGERELNGYDAAALAVFRVLLETDVRIVRSDRLVKQYVEGWTADDMPHSTLLAHDALWTISLASDVETRQLQIIATSWGNKNYPRPGQNYARSPVVVQNWDVPIPEWIAEWTY